MAWAITPEDRAKYTAVFEGLNPEDGKLSGETVRHVLMKSGLEVAQLGQIWVMSDIDKDGFLDQHEFIVSMHLTYKATNLTPLPSELPPELAKPTGNTLPQVPPAPQPTLPPTMGAIPAQLTGGADYSALTGLGSVSSEPAGFSANLITPPTPQNPSFMTPTLTGGSLGSGSMGGGLVNGVPNLLTGQAAPVPASDVPFCVTPEKYQSYIQIFVTSADGNTGLISAMDARGVFLQSGLPNPTLAQVWNLSDANQKGSLNKEEFVLSMHLLAAVLQGYELPSKISEHMLRAAKGNFTETEKMGGAQVIQQNVAPQVDPELQQLANELAQLQNEVNQIEAQVSSLTMYQSSTGDQVSTLQSEIDRKNQLLQSIEAENSTMRNQLSELDQQNMKMVMEQNELNSKLMSEKSQLQQAQMELMQYQSSPAPGQKERDEFNQLKQQEAQLEHAKTEALRLLTEVRSEKIRAQNIVDELQKEKDEKEVENDTPTPMQLPTVTPTPSAGSLKSLNVAGTPDVDPFIVSEPDLKAFGEPLEPEDPQAPPPSTPSGGTTPVAPSPVTLSAQEPLTKIESSLSEMSLKSGMTDLRNDIHHLDLVSPSSNSTEVETPGTAALNNLSAFTIPPQNDLTKNEITENDDFDPFGSVNVKISNQPVANDCKSNNDLMDDFFGSNSTPETVVPDPEIKDPFGEKSEPTKKDGFDGFGDPFGGGNVDPFGSPSGVSSDSKIVSPPIPPVIDDIQSFNEDDKDPFGSSSDPFGEKKDPFGEKDPFGSSSDPFGGSGSVGGGSEIKNDPFGAPSGGVDSDPFGGTSGGDTTSKESSDPWNAFDSAPAGGFGFESSFGQTELSPSDGKSSQIIPQKKAPSRPPPPRPNP